MWLQEKNSQKWNGKIVCCQFWREKQHQHQRMCTVIEGKVLPLSSLIEPTSALESRKLLWKWHLSSCRQCRKILWDACVHFTMYMYSICKYILFWPSIRQKSAQLMTTLEYSPFYNGTYSLNYTLPQSWPCTSWLIPVPMDKEWVQARRPRQWCSIIEVLFRSIKLRTNRGEDTRGHICRVADPHGFRYSFNSHGFESRTDFL